MPSLATLFCIGHYDTKVPACKLCSRSRECFDATFADPPESDLDPEVQAKKLIESESDLEGGVPG